MSVLCLVPDALRAARAARRLCDAEGGILFGARITTLDALAPGVLAAGGDGRALLSPLAERLLALDAGAAAGGPFGALEPGSGLGDVLASALAELRQGEVAPGEVRAAAGELGGRAGARLAALATALEAYGARLATLGALDRPAANLAAAAALEGPGASSADAEVRALDLLVLEGFSALTPAAGALVSALARRARRTHARVPFFPERPDVSLAAEPIVRRLEALHELRDVAIALEDLDAGGARAPRLGRLLRAVAGGSGGGRDGDEGLVLAGAGAGEEGEAEVAARLVAGLLDRGFSPEEVAVVAPSPAAAAPRLARAFAALGIPFAAGRAPLLAELLPVRAVRSALAAAVQPGRATLEAVAAAPYLGLAPIPARLGFWLDRAGALEGRGDPAEALARRAAALRSPAAAPERAALLRAEGALSQIRAALAPLALPALPRDHAARLRGFLSMAGARRRAARAERDVARRDLAALARVEEVADDVVRALALLGREGETLSAQRWRELLESALDGASGPAAPEPAAGAVELWALSDAPGLSARAAVVTGCGRGVFPAAPAGEPLLRDAERAALNRAAGRAAVASGPMRRAQALHAAFCALAAGREALALTWAVAGPDGGGAPAAPLAVEALVAAGVDVPGAPSRDPGAAESRSAAEALRAAARAARQASAAVAVAPELAGRAASALARGAIEAERRDAIVARRAAPAAGRLPSALLPELHRALPAEWSPSQLESHARCPYRLFAGLLLGLGDPDAAGLDIDPRDEGKLAHAVLERFLSARLARGSLPLRGAADELAGLRAVAQELFARFEADGRTGDPAVWAGRRAAVLARLERVLAAEAAEQDGTLPALLEYRFGGDSGVPPLVFGGEGQEVRLRGRLDRVDASAERLVLIDYKDARLGAEWKKKLDPGALGETNFQVPAYLMAAARALPGRARLDASYLLLRSAERAAPFTASPGDPLFALDEPARAAAREAGLRPFADAVVGVVRRIREGELPIASRDCTGCGFGAVCRAQALAEGEP